MCQVLSDEARVAPSLLWAEGEARRSQTGGEKAATSMAGRRGSGPRGDSSLTAICTLIERGSLDRKSKLESSGRICHVRSEPEATRDSVASRLLLSRRFLAGE